MVGGLPIRYHAINLNTIMTDLQFNMDIPKSHLFIIVAVMFLVAGFAIGVLIGNYTMHTSWTNYNELREKEIARDCICINHSVDKSSSTEMGTINFDKVMT